MIQVNATATVATVTVVVDPAVAEVTCESPIVAVESTTPKVVVTEVTSPVAIVGTDLVGPASTTPGPAGEQGPAGADGQPGATGAQGATGPAGVAFRYIGPTIPDTTDWEVDQFWYDTSTE